MKKQPLVLLKAPTLACLPLIVTVVFAYVDIFSVNGAWEFAMNPFTFEGLSAFEIYGRIMTMAIPVVLFLGILFLAEKSLRWVDLCLLFPVVWQLSNYIRNIETLDALLFSPMEYILPFVAVVFYILTVERILPTKWIFVGISFALALLPPVLSLFGIGEFVYTAYDYYEVVYWSGALSLSMYYLSLGLLGLMMKDPALREEPTPEEEPLSDEDFSEDEESDGEETE